jgi:hypothetical protein
MNQFEQGGEAALSREARSAAARVRGWLLSPQVQLREGIHAGAVAGALDNNGQARYVYPEITGYFLHWLAEAPDRARHDELRVAASRAADWVLRQFEAGGLPKTRVYLGDEPADWRNDAVFFFDLAMLLRGLCAAAQSHLIALPRELVQRLVAELESFVDDGGELNAARVLHAGAHLPLRWSTVGGPFEVKACSRVLLAARHVELPARLSSACVSLIGRYEEDTAALALEMLHPTLYFAEGMLLARPQRAPQIAGLLRRVLDLQHADGSLPEAQHDSALPRSDIIAQALRIGLLLRTQNIANAPDDRTLALLARALLARVGNGSSVSFRIDTADREPNVWCSLFAEQALRWYATWCEGGMLPAVEWLV